MTVVDDAVGSTASSFFAVVLFAPKALDANVDLPSCFSIILFTSSDAVDAVCLTFLVYFVVIVFLLLSFLAFYRDWETDRKSTRLNSSHSAKSRMPSSA